MDYLLFRTGQALSLLFSCRPLSLIRNLLSNKSLPRFLRRHLNFCLFLHLSTVWDMRKYHRFFSYFHSRSAFETDDTFSPKNHIIIVCQKQMPVFRSEIFRLKITRIIQLFLHQGSSPVGRLGSINDIGVVDVGVHRKKHRQNEDSSQSILDFWAVVVDKLLQIYHLPFWQLNLWNYPLDNFTHIFFADFSFVFAQRCFHSFCLISKSFQRFHNISK